jgi:hypothetical protein
LTQKTRLKIDDPDGYFSKLEYDGKEDYEGHINIQEGELPPRFPKFSYVSEESK